jgi:hypothetical protein
MIRQRTISASEEKELSRMSIDTSVAVNPPKSNLYTTSSSGNLAPQERSETADAETVISSVEGVILNVEEDYVRVKLGESAYVNLPKELFRDLKKTVEGQKVRYMLRKNIEGYRYQEVCPVIDTAPKPQREAVLGILSKIKYKDV